MELPKESVLLRVFVGEENVTKPLPYLDEVIQEGGELVTLERARVIRYQHAHDR